MRECRMEDKLTDEAARLAAVKRLDIFDTPRERHFDHITRLVQITLGVPVSAVSLIDDHRQWFKSVLGIDLTETPVQHSLCAVAIRHRDPLVVPDTLADSRFATNPHVVGPPHIRAYVGAPLVLPDGYQVGALCAIAWEPRYFSDSEVSVLTQLADCVVQEMELRQRAQVDTLTGLKSRHPFLRRLAGLQEHCHDTGTPAALSIFDLDHFKTINDSHGHAVGDSVLEAVAHAAQTALGSDVQIGRLGGEEFGIAFADTDLETVVARLTDLRQKIAALRFPGLPDLRVTASFGVAAHSADLPNVPAWCRMADAALYAAKQGGRDRIVVARDTLSLPGEVYALPYLRAPLGGEAERAEALRRALGQSGDTDHGLFQRTE